MLGEGGAGVASGRAGGRRAAAAQHESGALSGDSGIKQWKNRARSALRPLDIVGLSQLLVRARS